MKGKAETKRRLFGGLWHSDMSYAQEPPLGSALYGRVIPPYGGDTMGQYVPRLRHAVGPLEADAGRPERRAQRRAPYGSGGAVVNNGDPAHKMDVRTDDRAVQEVIHPVVRTRPRGARRCM